MLKATLRTSQIQEHTCVNSLFYFCLALLRRDSKRQVCWLTNTCWHGTCHTNTKCCFCCIAILLSHMAISGRLASYSIGVLCSMYACCMYGSLSCPAHQATSAALLKSFGSSGHLHDQYQMYDSLNLLASVLLTATPGSACLSTAHLQVEVSS